MQVDLIATIADWIGEINANQVTALGLVITAIVSLLNLAKAFGIGKIAKRGEKHAQAVNDAVNGNSPGTVRLFDLVFKLNEKMQSIEEWTKMWDGSPWRTGDEIALWVAQNEGIQREIGQALRDLKHDCPFGKDDVNKMVSDIEKVKKELAEHRDGGDQKPGIAISSDT